MRPGPDSSTRRRIVSLDVTAHHEAAHAVVAELLGLTRRRRMLRGVDATGGDAREVADDGPRGVARSVTAGPRSTSGPSAAERGLFATSLARRPREA